MSIVCLGVLHTLHRLFERTAHDVCVYINIAEKYKTMTLGGHNQAKQREIREKQLATSGSDWDIDTATHIQPQKVGLGKHPTGNTSRRQRSSTRNAPPSPWRRPTEDKPLSPPAPLLPTMSHTGLATVIQG